MFVKFCASGVARRVESLEGLPMSKARPSPIPGVWVRIQKTREFNERMTAWMGTAIYGHVALVNKNGGAVSERLLEQAGSSVIQATLGLIEATSAA